MKKTLRTTVCCIACTLLAASTWAQREPGSAGSSSSSGSQSSQSGISSQPSTSQGGLGSQTQRSSSYSSSSMHGQQQSLRVSQQVINAQVKTQDGQQLGQIEDLIANPQTGKIEFAVVSKGEKLYPIPMQLLQPQGGSQGSSSTSTTGTSSGTSSTSSTDPSSTTSTTPGLGSRSSSQSQGQRVTFVAQVDQQKLQQAPSFSKTQWPEFSATWSQQVYSHFGVQPEAAGGTSSGSSSQQGKSSGSSSSDPSKSSSSSSDTEKRSSQKSEN